MIQTVFRFRFVAIGPHCSDTVLFLPLCVATGNILLNIMVPSSMPCSRTGKNNVMVVCVPNPAVDEKNPSTPVPMLIRVKTAEDADELHKLILEKKG